jgi:hypothetical protein
MPYANVDCSYLNPVAINVILSCLPLLPNSYTCIILLFKSCTKMVSVFEQLILDLCPRVDFVVFLSESVMNLRHISEGWLYGFVSKLH